VIHSDIPQEWTVTDKTGQTRYPKCTDPRHNHHLILLPRSEWHSDSVIMTHGDSSVVVRDLAWDANKGISTNHVSNTPLQVPISTEHQGPLFPKPAHRLSFYSTDSWPILSPPTDVHPATPQTAYGPRHISTACYLQHRDHDNAAPVTLADYDTTQPPPHSTECKQTWYQWQTRIQDITYK